MFKLTRPLFYLGGDESLLNARQCSAAIDSGSGGDSTVHIAAAGVGYFTGGKTLSAGTFGYSGTTTKVSLFAGTSSLVAGADLSVARVSPVGYGNADKGFFSGGSTSDSGGIPNAWSVITDRLTYSTDVTVAVAGANIATATEGQAGVGTSTLGFITGGQTAVWTETDITERNTYSSETLALVAAANLSLARAFLSAAGNTTLGCFVSGSTPSLKKDTDVLTYSTETTAASSTGDIANVLGRNYIAAGGNLTTGYFAGGIGWVLQDVLTYATETMAVGAELPLTLSAGGSVGNLLGGWVGSSTMMHIDYTTGVAALARAASLPTASVHVASASTGIFT